MASLCDHIESDQDRLLYRAAPLPICVSLETAVRQAAFFCEKAFGVVPFARGFGVRVKAADFQEILTQIQPENSEQFIGKRWEISRLPLAMSKESLQDFLSGWPVTPLHTFRHGFRRTWIVRAAADPVEKIIAHDFRVAVIKLQQNGPRLPPNVSRLHFDQHEHSCERRYQIIPSRGRE